MLRILRTLRRDKGDAVLVTVVICIPLFMLAFMFSVGLAMNAWTKTSFADSAQAAAHTAAGAINSSGYLDANSLGTFVSEYMQLTQRTAPNPAQLAAGGYGTSEQAGLTCSTVTVSGKTYATPYIELRLDRTRGLGTSDQSSPLYVSEGGASPKAVFTLNTRVNYRVVSATVYEASTSLLGDGFAMLGKNSGCYTSKAEVSGITFGANEDLGLVGGDASCWTPTTTTKITDTVMKTNGSIKLYSGPDYTCPVVGYLSSPYVLTTHEYGSFYQISYGGVDYWVNNLETRAADSCTSRPIADRMTTNPPTQYSTGSLTGIKTYSAPFPDCGIASTISGEVTVVAQYVGPYGSYYQLTNGNWVNQNDLKAMQTIVFSANGGIGGGTVRVPNGSILTGYAPPARSGYIFSGWYTMPSGGGLVVFPRVVTGDATYYAQWATSSYTITWDGGGGNISGCSPTTYSISTAAITPNASTCSVKSRTGYTFNSWSPTSIPAGSIGNKTFTALWTITNYSISYNTNGGTTSSYCGPTSYNVNNTSISPSCTPTRTSYNFISWSPSSIPTGSTGNVTFTAQWSLQQYTVTFDTRGGTGVATQTVNQGSSVNPATPSKSGSTFWGWGTTSTAGAAPNVSFPKTVTADVTYYAHWTQNQTTGFSDSPSIYTEHRTVSTITVTASCGRGSYNGAAVRAFVYGRGGSGYTSWAGNGNTWYVYNIVGYNWGSSPGWYGETQGGACNGSFTTTIYN